MEVYRKRQQLQHISTIDTSPAHLSGTNLSGYCTLRYGAIPLQEMKNNPAYMVSILDF